MPFDLKSALEKVSDPTKRKALEDALKEQTEFISVLEATATELENEKSARLLWEEREKQIEQEFKAASEEYSVLVDSADATQKEKAAALKRVQELEAARIESEKRLADIIKSRPADIDTSKFLTQEEFVKRQRDMAISQTAYFGETLDTIAEVERLTGKRISPNQLIKDAANAKKTPKEYAEETYKLAEVRSESEKKATEKRDKENHDKGYQQALAEMRNPSLRTLEDSEDPFYASKTDKGPVQPWEEPDGFVPKAEQDFLKELTTKTVQ